MKTPLWDIEPFPSLLFDPDAERAKKLAAGLRNEGLPVEVVSSSTAMLTAAHETYFRTLVVAADLYDANCLALLDELRVAAPGGWLIAICLPADDAALAVAHLHGVDCLLPLSVSPPDLSARIAALQLRSRPRI